MIKILVFSLLLKTCLCQRRIVEGSKVHNEVRFMAYLVKSERSEKFYHGWTCGGAIITPLHILTAAACVIDVDHLYAIVGYNKYVSADALEDDPCTRNRKKRVVRTCAPKTYNVLLTGWTNHDIGIAELESPLDFTDATYKIDCSYPPALIKVNFDPQYEAPDMDVVTMGWGHAEKLRLPHHLQDHNEQFLQEAALLTVKREVCEKKFDYDPAVERIVENDIICVEGHGNLDAEGKELQYGPERFKCDINETEVANTTTPNTPANDTTKNMTTEFSNTMNTTIPVTNATVATKEPTPATTKETTTKETTTKATTTEATTTKETLFDYYDDRAYDELFQRMGGRRNAVCRRYLSSRRRGLCQNDHGGPLIAWMGVNPIVIGVASTNLYNVSFACITPNLFTSTLKNEWFIKCAIKKDPETLRACNEMATRNGLRMHEQISNWLTRSNIQKAPRINPSVVLQNALKNYLRDQNILNNLPQPHRTYHRPQILRSQNGPFKSLSNYEKHLLIQNLYNHNTHQQNVPGFQQQKESNLLQDLMIYAKHLQNNQNNLPGLQQIVPNLLQIVPNSQEIVNTPQQNVPSYQQRLAKYIEANYQRDVTQKQKLPIYKKNFPINLESERFENIRPKTTIVQLRPQKSIRQGMARSKATVARPMTAMVRPTTTMVRPKTTMKLRTSGKLQRRRTLKWRRNMPKITASGEVTTLLSR